jgi:hypothetical protein
MLLVPLKSLGWVGVHFVGSIMFWPKVEKLVNIEQVMFSLKIHLNQNKKLWCNLGMLFGIVGKSWVSGI